MSAFIKGVGMYIRHSKLIKYTSYAFLARAQDANIHYIRLCWAATSVILLYQPFINDFSAMIQLTGDAQLHLR